MIKIQKFIIALLIVALGLGMGYTGVRAFSTNAMADEQLDMDNDPKMLKERYDMDIKPCNNKPKITKEQAIDFATKNRGGANDAKIVHAQYCALSFSGIVIHPEDRAVQENPALKGKDSYQDTPVWLVSFRGIDSGNRGGKSRTEVNFVVDATSGVVLFGFSYR